MTARKPAAPGTAALVLVTVATYLAQLLSGGDVVERAIGLIPARASDLAPLAAVGSCQPVPSWLTLVTYMFPHGAWWHITMNMAGLWFFGRIAEPLMGTGRFVLAYIASGVVTGLVIVWLGPRWTKPVAGASGAISGILGAVLALRLPRWPPGDRRNLGVLAVESACLLGVVAWLLVRTTPRVPDRMSALMWHLIPFLAGWMGIRAGRRACRKSGAPSPVGAAPGPPATERPRSQPA
jgi:membrane associated rhomboid family serine protease